MLSRWSGREITELQCLFNIEKQERENPDEDLDARARMLAERM